MANKMKGRKKKLFINFSRDNKVSQAIFLLLSVKFINRQRNGRAMMITLWSQLFEKWFLDRICFRFFFFTFYFTNYFMAMNVSPFIESVWGIAQLCQYKKGNKKYLINFIRFSGFFIRFLDSVEIENVFKCRHFFTTKNYFRFWKFAWVKC